MAYTFDLNVAQSYAAGRYVLKTLDGLFWNLIYEQESSGGNYGAFYDTTDQTHLLTASPIAITINSTLLQNGVRLVGGDKIYYDNDGVYSITYSIQLTNEHADIHEVNIWLSKNGVAQPNTNSIFSVAGKHGGQRGSIVATVNYVVAMNAGQYHQLFWTVNDLDTRIETVAGTGGVPDSPGVIFTVIQATDITGSGNSNRFEETLSADTTVNGTTISKTAGESLVFGDVVYFKSDGKAWKAKANEVGKYPALAMATGTIAADETGIFLLWGVARNDAWAWTIGGSIYLSTTAGTMSQTPPSATDNAIQILGVAHPDATTLYFKPSIDYITLL